MDAQKSELAQFSSEPVKMSGPNVIRGHLVKASHSELEIKTEDTDRFYDEASAIEYAKRFVAANPGVDQ